MALPLLLSQALLAAGKGRRFFLHLPGHVLPALRLAGLFPGPHFSVSRLYCGFPAASKLKRVSGGGHVPITGRAIPFFRPSSPGPSLTPMRGILKFFQAQLVAALAQPVKFPLDKNPLPDIHTIR